MGPQNSTPQPSVPQAPTPQPSQDAVSGGVAPIGSPAPNPGPAKPNKKKLIIFSAIGVVLLAAIVTLAIIFLPKMIGVSKADYMDAAKEVSSLGLTYSDIGSVYLTTSSTQTEIDNGLESLKSKAQKFEDEFAKVGELKAVKNDSEINKAYKDAEAKLPDFKASLDVTTEAYSKVMPVLADYTKLGYSPSAADITSVKERFDSLKDLKDQNNKDFASKMSGLLGTYAPLVQKVEDGRKDYKKYDADAYKQYSSTRSDINTAMRDWQSNFRTAAQKGELKDALNAFIRAVSKKALEYAQ